MESVSSAYAQTQSISPLQDGTTWIFLLAALVLAGAALYFIVNKFEVTSGHAIVLAVALGTAALPYVASFEWTKDGFKFTTKGESLELAKQIEDLTRNDTQLRQQLNVLTNALENANRRLVALEITTARTGGPAPPPSEMGQGVLQSFQRQNEAIIQQNASRLEDLAAFQRKLQAPIQ